MDRGSVAECTNPSAAIMGRINDAKMSRRHNKEAGKDPDGRLQGHLVDSRQMFSSDLWRSGRRPADVSDGPASRFASGDATLEDLEDFIMTGRLDANAEKALRNEGPDIQVFVMNRGGLENCLNPSSAVMGRISEARKHIAKGHSQDERDANSLPDEEVSAFVEENRLDENASRALRSEPADIQRAVIDRGTLVECVNPSAAVMGRIRDAKACKATGMPLPVSTAYVGVPNLDMVEQFIQENNLDENAARALRSELPEVQAEVLERGSLADCVNASAAVMGRIRDARARKTYERERIQALSERSAGGDRSSLSERERFSAGCGGASATAFGGASPLSLTRHATVEEVERFISDNRLDESATRALRSVPPDVQGAVLDRGPLASTANPSSAVMGRLRDAKQLARSQREMNQGGQQYGMWAGGVGVGRSSPY